MKTTLLNRRSAWIGAALLALAGITFWSLNSARAADKKAPRATPPVQVTTVPVKPQDVPMYRSGIGTAAASATVTVKTRVDGQLDELGFTEGQDVKAGQVLARLDPRTLRAQLAQVQAQKAKDMAQLANARTDLQRYTTLIAEDAATKQQVDTQKALVAQLEAATQTDDAQINYAQVQLGFTTITAPMSGRAGAHLVDPGNIVHATDANGIVVINKIDPISVVFTVPEEAFQAINSALNTGHESLAVEAYARDGNELLAKGKLVLLNNQIDTTNGTIQIKGSFANPQHKLWPGEFVNVRLILGVRQRAITVPAAAVQRGQEGTYAYVVNDDGKTVRNQPITVAIIQDGIAVIDKGLALGQRVVLDGQYKLRPGAQIVESAPRQGGGGGRWRGGAASAPAAESSAPSNKASNG
jgi:multidrug efflux system membrane fusion protein